MRGAQYNLSLNIQQKLAAHGRVCVGSDGNNGRAGFSDLQIEELPLLQAQVVTYQVQQNHAFILLLQEANNKHVRLHSCSFVHVNIHCGALM